MVIGSKPGVGTCHICLCTKQLTYEHIPPKAAFNDRPTIDIAIQDAISLGPNSRPRGPLQQRGVGRYSLCEGCNNKTGHWYGKDFVDWCYQGAFLLLRSEGKPSLQYRYHIFPLNVLKQIASMFLSINDEWFCKGNEELARFVANPRVNHLSPTYRFFVHYNISNALRSVGHSVKANLETGNLIELSEITFPPFGYVMTLDSDPPDNRLVEITYFSKFEYREAKDLWLSFPVLPVVGAAPGFY